MPGFDEPTTDHAADTWKTPLVRPYTISGGRTHSRRELGPKTKICATAAQDSPAGLRPELHDIVRLCRTPASLAEIAAALAIPLCIVDVLVDDLCGRGLVTIYQIELAPHGGRHRSAIAPFEGLQLTPA